MNVSLDNQTLVVDGIQCVILNHAYHFRLHVVENEEGIETAIIIERQKRLPTQEVNHKSS